MIARLTSWWLLSAWLLGILSLPAFGQDMTELEVASQSARAANFYKEEKYREAAELYEQLLPAVERLHGKDSKDTATLLNRLANLYLDMSQYAKAEPLYRRSLHIREAQFGKDDPVVAASLNNLAVVCKVQGHYAQAAPLYQRSLDIWQARLGKDDPRVATSLNNLANLYSDLGQYGKAEPMYQRSLHIRETQLGEDHPAVAQSLNNLAYLSKVQGRYADAEKLYQRSLRLREAKFGKNHTDVAESLKNLAHLYYAMGKYADAEPMYRRSRTIYEATFGKTYDGIAQIFTMQADLAWAKQEPEQAIGLLRQAVEIYRARYGTNHPLTNHTQSRLALFLHQRGRAGEAVRIMERTMHALRVHTAQVLPSLPESEQLHFMKTSFAEDFLDAVSLALPRYISDENRLRTAGWVVNGKSIIQQSLAERLLLARDNQTSEARRALAELEDVRRLLARLHLNGPEKTDVSRFRKDVESLQEKEKQLETRLNDTGLTNRNDPWIEIDELRQKLPANTVFVDFLCFEPTDFGDLVSLKRKRLPSIYVAWITSADKETAIINLGPAATIDAAIQEARKELQGVTDRIKSDGEPNVEKVARRKLAAVSQLVLAPLLPHIKAYDKWIFGPDGNLWLIPWACLPLNEQEYVIEKHVLRCVTSGRDLVLNPLQLDFKASAPVIFADPDFDLDPSQVAKPGEADLNRSLRTSLSFAGVKRLPGTAFEAAAITPALTKFANVAPRSYLEGKATVSAFQKLKSPKILVMSTHGYFQPDQEVPAHLRANDVEKPKSLPGLENPLVRSGLLLAGCKQGVKGRQTGVLTGLEIIGTDLRGTELVVLSACETGLGDIRNGEGVAGLRQAFQLAGAQAVVATLWQIPDIETVFLMKSFFENISAGQTRVDALREAQLSMLRQRRDRHGAGHPYFWAAFTVTGR